MLSQNAHATHRYRVRRRWALAHIVVRWHNHTAIRVFFCCGVVALQFFLLNRFAGYRMDLLLPVVIVESAINAVNWTNGCSVVLTVCCSDQTTTNNSIVFSKCQFLCVQKEVYLRLAVWVFALYAVGSCGNANGCTSSENESLFKSRTWNLFRPLNTISRFLGLRWRCGDCFNSERLLRLLMLPMPESAEISRCAWNPFLVVLATCLAFFVSIGWRGTKLTGTGYCGFGKLDVCNVNFETIVVAACGVGRTLKHKKQLILAQR